MIAENKLKVIVTYILLVIGVFIGVFVAIRLKNESLLECATNYGFIPSSITSAGSLSGFFWRLISCLILTVLMIVFSLNIFLYAIAELILIYRAYLVGLNVVMIILLGGFSGIFTAILIVLPCQICMLIAMSTFFCFFSGQCRCGDRSKWKTLLAFVGLLVLIDAVETVLLCIFGANIILVV